MTLKSNMGNIMTQPTSLDLLKKLKSFMTTNIRHSIAAYDANDAQTFNQLTRERKTEYNQVMGKINFNSELLKNLKLELQELYNLPNLNHFEQILAQRQAPSAEQANVVPELPQSAPQVVVEPIVAVDAQPLATVENAQGEVVPSAEQVNVAPESPQSAPQVAVQIMAGLSPQLISVEISPVLAQQHQSDLIKIAKALSDYNAIYEPFFKTLTSKQRKVVEEMNVTITASFAKLQARGLSLPALAEFEATVDNSFETVKSNPELSKLSFFDKIVNGLISILNAVRNLMGKPPVDCRETPAQKVDGIQKSVHSFFQPALSEQNFVEIANENDAAINPNRPD